MIIYLQIPPGHIMQSGEETMTEDSTHPGRERNLRKNNTMDASSPGEVDMLRLLPIVLEIFKLVLQLKIVYWQKDDLTS